MPIKLNQILAIEKDKKTKLNREISDDYKALQKPQLLNGHVRRFTPSKEDGEKFPDERQHVQIAYSDVFKSLRERLVDLMDVVATKDYTNCNARADVMLGDEKIIENAPVPYLLFLEKHLQNMYTFFDKMVELDSAEEWKLDEDAGLRVSSEVKAQRTKKLQKPIVLYQATDKHPAQTQLITEDVVIGTWTTKKYSGAIPKVEKKKLLDRVSKLQDAVKFAREEANSVNAEQQAVGERIMEIIFGDR